MKLSLFIAKRYLLSKKKQNAINIISIISVIGVIVGTAALIIVFSVFNGLENILKESMDSFSPDISISKKKGSSMTVDTNKINILIMSDYINDAFPIVEGNVVVKSGDSFTSATIKGANKKWITRHILDKYTYILKNNTMDSAAIIGYNIAYKLGLIRNTKEKKLSIFHPENKSSILNNGLRYRNVPISGFFSAQKDIDNKYIILPIDIAQDVIGLNKSISKLEVSLVDEKYEKQAKQLIMDTFGNEFSVKSKYELNPAFYAVIKSERLSVFLVLLFIMIVASFNIIGSISMLILDKKSDIKTYNALGMSEKKILSIFKTEGYMITFVGLIIGLIIGIAVCLIQEEYGILKIGNNSFIMNAYPVALRITDIFIVAISVSIIGYIASVIPGRLLIKPN